MDKTRRHAKARAAWELGALPPEVRAGALVELLAGTMTEMTPQHDAVALLEETSGALAREFVAAVGRRIAEKETERQRETAG